MVVPFWLVADPEIALPPVVLPLTVAVPDVASWVLLFMTSNLLSFVIVHV
jgi:hypothetical protein